MNHHAEAGRAVLPVDAAKVGQEVEALGVAEEADGFHEVFAGDLVGRHVLRSQDLRARKTVGQDGGFHDVNDIFSQVFGDAFGDAFGGRGGGRQSHGPRRGSDLRYDLEISLEQAYKGAEVEIDIPATMTCETCEGSGAKPGTKPVTCTTCGGIGQVRMQQGFFSVQQTCPRCHGSGKMISDPCTSCHGQGRVEEQKTLSVKVPPGVDTGDRIRLQGEGEVGQPGAPSGDLYVDVQVRPHAVFERDGDDLACSVPVKFSIAALGGKIVVPKLKGKTTLNIPAGTQGGTIFRLRGEGMPPLRGSTSGDLLVRVDIDVPKKMTDKEKEALKAYAAACGDEAAPVSESWRSKFKKFFP